MVKTGAMVNSLTLLLNLLLHTGKLEISYQDKPPTKKESRDMLERSVDKETSECQSDREWSQLRSRIMTSFD